MARVGPNEGHGARLLCSDHRCDAHTALCHQSGQALQPPKIETGVGAYVQHAIPRLVGECAAQPRADLTGVETDAVQEIATIAVDGEHDVCRLFGAIAQILTAGHDGVDALRHRLREKRVSAHESDRGPRA